MPNNPAKSYNDEEEGKNERETSIKTQHTHRDPIEITLIDDISSHFHTTSVDRIGKR